ncbi:hypothetical protein [Opitutus sp. ER46]|uniref:hypothetical protein n=1 Tax=Opitutus sp. ER46 TaxID=2161864 RepID=UPI0011B2724C|nr:hypothetical protein [Opitutus sp. ER46]
MTVGIYMISGCAVPAQQLGDHGYFGLSIDVDRRFDQHERDLKKNQHCNQYLQNCFNLYGGSNYFVWSVVEECEKEELSDKEIQHIKDGNTYENPRGFNMTPGGYEGVSVAAAKPFAFRDAKTGTLFIGTNLSQFCRDQPQYDYVQLSRLRRGEIQIYMDLIALDVPELGSS